MRRNSLAVAAAAGEAAAASSGAGDRRAKAWLRRDEQRGGALSTGRMRDFDEIAMTRWRSRRRHAGIGSFQPMSTNDELIEQLRGDIKEIQISLLLVIQDKTFDCDQ
ncbi:hypothetical protein Scep_012273 [Stephania cephalantha]|uniref:Uncharacterized protein n=1 Tax=Stephania cephalantha TaxID=152367 RepID=A0AAP0P9D2_9MAGN